MAKGSEKPKKMIIQRSSKDPNKGISKRTKKFARKGLLENQVAKGKVIKKIKSEIAAKQAVKNKRDQEKSEKEKQEQTKEDEEKELNKKADDLDPAYFKEDEDQDEDEDVEDEENDEDVEADILAHHKELELLKKSDPSFAAYLQKEEKSIAAFGEEEAANKASAEGEKVITSALFAKWKREAVEKNSLDALKRLVMSFRIAVTSTEENEEGDESTGQYRIISTSLRSAITNFCVTQLAKVFNIHLKRKEGTPKTKRPDTFPNWSTIRIFAKSFLQSALTFIDQRPAKEALDHVLKHLESYAWMLPAFEKLTRQYIKVLLDIWQSADESSRILAFILLREIIITRTSQSILEKVLKSMYLTYVRNSKFTTPNNISLVNFMANCVVEIYSIDFGLSYQFAFVYIRQLAIHLRNAIAAMSQDGYGSVYNWQYVNSLKVWALLLTAHPNGQLQPLVYPVVQVIFGVMKLLPTSRYFPLRFMCARMLNGLAAASGTFINVVPQLLEVLNSHEMNEKPKGSNRPLDFSVIIKVSNTQRRTSSFQMATLSSMFELILENFTIYSRSIAFPELILPTIVMIKAYLKKKTLSTNPMFTKRAKQLMDHLNNNAAFVTKHRHSVDFGPQMKDKVNDFLKNTKAPLENYFEQFKKEEAKAKLEKFNADKELADDDMDDDDDDDMEDSEEEKPKSKKAQKKEQNIKKLTGKKSELSQLAAAAKAARSQRTMENDDDIVEDLVLSDDD
eukprot:TRINITY_DN3664_c0_g1_i2.p1 TRINITY_DN3664_c0_g1~~TRINITY_DN3664_c0_g1_i2.p1  ORF type:complete len:735 (+),score=233.27 TRINITY_DN3664_c0_g1_i2:175-2379(+)